MKTREQELAELEQKTAKEREHIERKHAILGTLSARVDIVGYAPPFIHIGKLYGSVGSLHFKIQRYSSIAEGKSPDVELLERLLVAIPPVETVKHSDGCTSIRPEPESYESNGEYTEIDPVYIDVEPESFSQNISVKWYGELNGDIWRVEMEFPLHNPKLGRLDLRVNRYAGGHGDICGIDVCQYYPADKNARVIRWAAGDRKTPNRFTIYWERGRNVNIPDLFRQ